ncbi:AMP-binding protein [Bacillus sp. JJ1533]|uniref:AMP-dependent synthetase/ligase n=1 Tax=Bacillus sp. JJ1533 TaxID=3122959 RepID=UPI00300088A2
MKSLASSGERCLSVDGVPPKIQDKYKEKLMLNNTIPIIFLNQVLRLGDKPAIRHKVLGIWKETSWNEYYEHVKLFASGLKASGFKKGDKLAILVDNCPEWIYADLATQHIGGISVGIPISSTQSDLHFMLSHSDAKVCVVSDQEQLDKVLECKVTLPKLEKIIVINVKGIQRYLKDTITTFRAVQETGKKHVNLHPDEYLEELLSIEKHDVSMIVYTSGSTGSPKGAMITQHNILTSVIQFQSVCKLYEGDTVVSFLPLPHMLERIMSLYSPLYIGGIVNFAESVETVEKDLKEIAPTLFVAVPRILEKIYSNHLIKMKESTFLGRVIYKQGTKVGLNYINKKSTGDRINFGLKVQYRFFHFLVFRRLLDHLGLRRVRVCINGFGSIAHEIIKFYRMLGLEIREGYGQTECTGFVTVHQGDDYLFGTVGKNVPGVEVTLNNEGEVLIKGKNIFAGYYKDFAASASAVNGEWLQTGDIGRFVDSGQLYLVGRKKDIFFTSEGTRISPQEIEKKFKVSPYIKEMILIGKDRKFLTALIEVDVKNIGYWMQKNKIPYTTFKNMVQNEKVVSLIQQEISTINNLLPLEETIKRFTLLEKELDQSDEELTSIFMLRRETIEGKYKDVIEGMYSEKEGVV